MIGSIGLLSLHRVDQDSLLKQLAIANKSIGGGVIVLAERGRRWRWTYEN